MNERQFNIHKTKPKISVVLPVFNAQKYVGNAVRSILSQSFTNFELIVINDGSSDGTTAILSEFQKQDSRLILISRDNKGLVASLNEGVDLARGEWIARMDADDIALPQRFERQLQWLEQTGADICGSWIQLFGTADKRIIKHSQTDGAIKMELLFGSPFAHPTVMMRSELVRNLRYDSVWEKAEDYDLWERAARSGWKMTNVPEVLLQYRQHETQISTAASTKQHQLTQLIQRRYWSYVFDEMGLNKVWIDEVLKLREPTTLNPDMNYVDLAFTELLNKSQGEARAIIFDHATRLYFRVAGICPNVVSRWAKLNKNYGNGFAMTVKAKLWILSVFHIDPNSRLFHHLKKLYFYFIRST